MNLTAKLEIIYGHSAQLHWTIPVSNVTASTRHTMLNTTYKQGTGEGGDGK